MKITPYILTEEIVSGYKSGGFPLLEYDGSNTAINEQLRLAAKYRKQSVRFIAIGVPTYVLAGNAAFIGMLMDGFSGSGSSRTSPTTVLSITVSMGGLAAAVGGGSWKKAQARRRVRTAHTLYWNE
ncbi:MAG: hypothetical protein WBA23_25300 [Tunicatimonas sp.]|uniref:hypothetical protein n=1 Tax=Tunicatimonas sp. TaxID=1940096 RepID=UPI003C770F74